MLGCKAQVLLVSPKVIRVLSGDFTPDRSDIVHCDAEFLTAVFTGLPEAAMYTDSVGTIVAANDACLALFAQTLVGKDIKKFMAEKFGQVDIREPVVLERVSYERAPGDVVRLEVRIHPAQGHTLVFFREHKLLFEYQSAIEQALTAQEALISRVLPASLIRKFHRDGKRSPNFAVVQNPSIVFVRIVNFVQWAETVLPTVAIGLLNDIFKEFDQIVAARPSMMKVKTMGDLYMALGGVFCEVASPHEHAT
jgi:hypothetical protein